MMGVISESNDAEYAVIEILIPLVHMNPKYYYQAVPLHKTEDDMIYVKNPDLLFNVIDCIDKEHEKQYVLESKNKSLKQIIKFKIVYVDESRSLLIFDTNMSESYEYKYFSKLVQDKKHSLLNFKILIENI